MLDKIQAEFGLHEIAVEDAGSAHQKPMHMTPVKRIDQTIDGVREMLATA